MPLIQKTVYIREEDIDKWNALPNKAAWLHEHLNDSSYGKIKPTDAGKIISFNSKGSKTVDIPESCEHFQPKGSCMVKGCKYGAS